MSPKIIAKSRTISLIYLLVVLFVLVPNTIFAQIVNPPGPAADTGITYDCENEHGGKPGECTFQDLVKATKRFTDKATQFALAFSVVVIAVAGGRFMISGENASERTKAKKMLWSVVKGICFILAAWLIVTLILSALGVDSIVKLG